MRRAWVGLVVAGLSGCSSCGGSDAVSSVPDDRLGVVVFETNDRPFSRAPSIDTQTRNQGHVLINRARVVLDASGVAYVVIGLDAGRPFGTPNDVTPARVVVRKVTPDGKVTSLPSPALGSGGLRGDTSVQLAGDGMSVVIVDAHGIDNPSGRYVMISMLDGDQWRQVSFLRSDRPPLDTKSTWSFADDQVRVLRPGAVVVEHGDALARWDGASWLPVELPVDVKEVRLGPADADRVRVYWLTRDGLLESDALGADGQWVGPRTRSNQGSGAKALKGVWGSAGDVDTFLLHYVAGDQVIVLRQEGGVLRPATQRPAYQGELIGKAYLAPTRHPHRSAFVASTGELKASFDGRESGSLGTILGWASGPSVTCEGDVTVSEGMSVAADGAKCTPRSIDALDYRVGDDVGSLVELFADSRQDVALRFYLKRIALPTNVTDVTQAPPATGTFPGETVGTTDQVRLSGRILTPGTTDHSGTRCVLTQRGPEAASNTDPTGAIEFPPQARGMVDVTCARTGFLDWTQTLDLSGGSEFSFSGVLVHGSIRLSDLPSGGESELQLEGNTLTRQDSSGLSTLSTSVASGDSVRVWPQGQVLWREGSGSFRTSVTSVDFPAPRDFSSFRLFSGQLGVAQGTPDGAHEWSWTLGNGTSPLLAVPAIDVVPFSTSNSNNCSGAVVWKLVGAESRAQRATCQPPLNLVAGTQSTSQIPVVGALTSLGDSAVGFIGAGCGVEGAFTHSCPLMALSPLSGSQPLTGTVVLNDAIESLLQVVPGLGMRLVMLERSANGFTLRTTPFGDVSTSVVVATGVSLPTTWTSGERPVIPLNGAEASFLVRTFDEAYLSTGAAGSWTRVATAVKAIFPDGLIVKEDGTLLQVTSGGTIRTLPMAANANLRVTAQSLYSDETTMTCPDGSTCHVVQRLTVASGVVTSLGVGRLTPDVASEPIRFGAPNPRSLKVMLDWPQRVGRLGP